MATSYTRNLIDRAAAQIVRQAGQLRVDQIADLPNRIRLDLFPVGVAVELGPHGAVRYVRVCLGHADGFEDCVIPDLIQHISIGDIRRATDRAIVAVEAAVEHARRMQIAIVALSDDELATQLDGIVTDESQRSHITAELARRARLAPRARTREDREFGRAPLVEAELQ